MQTLQYDIAQFAKAIMHGGTVEVRIIGARTYPKSTGETWSGYFDDPGRLAKVVKDFEAKYKPPAIYITSSPCDPSLKGRAYNKLVRSKHATKDSDIPRRLWLLIDVDAKKPSGTSATDAQMQEALTTRDEIASELQASGFSEPIITASGNGGGLLYRVDLPNDTQANELVADILAKLKAKYPQVDTSVGNPANLTKLAGTWARKGDEVDGQKHRQSGYILPSSIVPTSREVLEAYAPHGHELNTLAKSASGLKPNAAQYRAHKFALKVCHALDCSIATEPLKRLDSGALLYPFTSASTVCKQHADGPHKQPSDAWLMIFPDGGIEFQCHHDGCQWGKWQEDFVKPSGQGYEQSDYGVSRRVVDYVGPNYLWVPSWNKWAIFSGKVYECTGASPALQEPTVAISKAMAVERAKPSNPSDKDAMRAYEQWLQFANSYQSTRKIRDVETLCRGQLTIGHDAFDQQHALLPCENIVLDLRTGKALPHSPEFKFTKLAPVVFDPRATCPRWQQFIDEITVGDAQLADYLKRICGYCLSGLVTEEVLIVLYGDGSNGKSVFTRTLLNLLGEDFAGPIGQELLMASPNQHPTQFAALHGKRCVVAQETDQDCRLNEAQVKALTGGDKIQCRRMREDFWSFAPTHKILMATNHLPIIRGTDKGIWRRIKMVPFNATFDGAGKDTGLQEKLNAELSGILNWCLEGFRAYLFDGLHEPKAVTHARDTYREDMDITGQFVEAKCVLEVGATVTTADLYEAFRRFCESTGAFAGRVPSARKLNHEINKLPGVVAEKVGGVRRKKGIRLKGADNGPMDPPTDPRQEPLFFVDKGSMGVDGGRQFSE